MMNSSVPVTRKVKVKVTVEMKVAYQQQVQLFLLLLFGKFLTQGMFGQMDPQLLKVY
jgi:hypothetical protein